MPNQLLTPNVRKHVIRRAMRGASKRTARETAHNYVGIRHRNSTISQHTKGFWRRQVAHIAKQMPDAREVCSDPLLLPTVILASSNMLQAEPQTRGQCLQDDGRDLGATAHGEQTQLLATRLGLQLVLETEWQSLFCPDGNIHQTASRW